MSSKDQTLLLQTTLPPSRAAASLSSPSSSSQLSSTPVSPTFSSSRTSTMLSKRSTQRRAESPSSANNSQWAPLYSSYQFYNYEGRKRPGKVVFKIYQGVYDANGNFVNQTISEIQGVPCNLLQWQSNFGKSTADSLDLYMKRFPTFCMPENVSLALQGRYEQNYSMVSISFEKCTEEDCLTEQEIKNLKQPIVYNYLFPRLRFDPLNLTNQEYYLEDNHWFQSHDLKVSRSEEIHLTYNSVNDIEINVLPTSFQYFKNKSAVTYFLDIQKIVNTNYQREGMIGQFTFRLSNLSKNYIRSINKLDKLINSAGGFFFIIQILSIILIRPFNQRKMRRSMHRRVKSRVEEKEFGESSYTYFHFLKQMYESWTAERNQIQPQEKISLAFIEKCLNLQSFIFDKCTIYLKCLQTQRSKLQQESESADHLLIDPAELKQQHQITS